MVVLCSDKIWTCTPTLSFPLSCCSHLAGSQNRLVCDMQQSCGLAHCVWGEGLCKSVMAAHGILTIVKDKAAHLCIRNRKLGPLCHACIVALCADITTCNLGMSDTGLLICVSCALGSFAADFAVPGKSCDYSNIENAAAATPCVQA